MHQGAHLEGSWGEESVLVPDVDAAVALLRDELRPGDVVLVKASNALGLWRVADALLRRWWRVKGILIAAAVALFVSILFTPYLIRLFSRQGFGQEIREEGPKGHAAKRGTPTMGGVAILVAMWAGYIGRARGQRVQRWHACRPRPACWCCC